MKKSSDTHNFSSKKNSATGCGYFKTKTSMNAFYIFCGDAETSEFFTFLKNEYGTYY